MKDPKHPEGPKSHESPRDTDKRRKSAVKPEPEPQPEIQPPFPPSFPSDNRFTASTKALTDLSKLYHSDDLKFSGDLYVKGQHVVLQTRGVPMLFVTI